MNAKKKPEVCIIDYDDCCAGFTDAIIKAANIINKTTYSPEDVKEWDLPKDLRDVYHRFEKSGLYNEMKPLPFAIDALKHLKFVKNQRIIILTARPECFGEATYLNMIMNDIPFDELIFKKDKVSEIKKLSKKYHVKLFVDDKLETVKNVCENCSVETICLMDRAHNRSEELDPDIIRISNLLECIKYIK